MKQEFFPFNLEDQLLVSCYCDDDNNNNII